MNTFEGFVVSKANFFKPLKSLVSLLDSKDSITCIDLVEVRDEGCAGLSCSNCIYSIINAEARKRYFEYLLNNRDNLSNNMIDIPKLETEMQDL